MRDVKNSIEHTLLYCQYSRVLWGEVTDWIRELGMVDYNMSNTQTITGDLENALAINSIILHTKKVIYNAMKKNKGHAL